MAGPEQIPLDFGHQPAFAPDDFLQAGSNRDAAGWIDRWPVWPAFALGLWGDAGSGKSHLAHIFRQRTEGVIVAAGDLTCEGVPLLAEYRSVAVEDVDRGLDEAALFHLYNLLRETGRFLLVTGRTPPSRWSIALPDLKSRLSAIPAVAINPPDDALLEALLVKLFFDRQLRVPADVLAFLLARMERSFEAARRLVAAIDAQALAEQRAVTIPLVRAVIDGVPSLPEA